MGSLWVGGFLIFLFILVNGFFAASEIAIVASRRSHQIKRFTEEGSKEARVLSQLQGDPDRFLATVQIGVTLAGSLASAVGGVMAVKFIGPVIETIPSPLLQKASEFVSVGIVVLVISYLTLVWGELLPKSLAVRYPEKIALWVARPIDSLSRIVSFGVRILTSSSQFLLRLFGVKSSFERSFASEEEIKYLLREGREQGVFDQTEQELIHSVFEFADISVKEVMVPRPKIHILHINTPLDEALRYIVEDKFSRYPVYRTDVQDIVGILYYKSLLEAVDQKKAVTVKDLLHPVYFVPETMKVSRLLKEFQRRRIQMAIVVSEYGSVEGLVTMEDLIEEIVGEIQDESDTEEGPVERLKDGSLLIDASLSVRDLAADWGLPIPESAEYETLGGFVLSRLQNMPRGGEITTSGEYKFTIVDMDGRRIAKVRAERIAHPIKSSV